MAERPSIHHATATHLILVGIPGAGKSTLGPLVANVLGLPFVDLDVEIERRAGRTVREIFRNEGEQGFRRLEREATTALLNAPPMVVAPGGGWITQPDVVALLCPPSRIVHLHVSPSTALARMGNQVAARPLLTGEDPLATLVGLARNRAPSYGVADVMVDTEAVAVQELVSQIAALASSWGVRVG